MRKNAEVENFALQEGADLAGTVSVENLMTPHPWRPPQGVMPEAESVAPPILKLPPSLADRLFGRLDHAHEELSPEKRPA
jgi:hypothetical protein